MTRDDIIWAAIRIFGIFFFVKAVFAVPSAIGGVYTLYLLSALNLEGLSPDVQTTVISTATRAAPAVSGLFAVIFYTVAGAYFIRGAPALARRIQE